MLVQLLVVLVVKAKWLQWGAMVLRTSGGGGVGGILRPALHPKNYTLAFGKSKRVRGKNRKKWQKQFFEKNFQENIQH